MTWVTRRNELEVEAFVEAVYRFGIGPIDKRGSVSVKTENRASVVPVVAISSSWVP